MQRILAPRGVDFFDLVLASRKLEWTGERFAAKGGKAG
jgi:hypothetical protein